MALTEPPMRYPKGEITVAMLWLSAGAVISLILEVAYLGMRLPLPGLGHVSFPITIVVAALFNCVLTRTAALWSRNIGIVALPVTVWGVGYILFFISPIATGDQFLSNHVWSILLMVAGVAGGLWPIISPTRPH